jgi:drug/metabolite transporter (DMT)-like permease
MLGPPVRLSLGTIARAAAAAGQDARLLDTVCRLPDASPMDSTALALVLGAAFFHAGWNIRLHRTEDRLAAMAVSGLTIFAVLLPATLVWPPSRAAWVIPFSAAAETVYALTLAAAYGRGALSFAYPVGRGTAPVLVTLGGWVLLHERPTALAVTGALALGLGLTLLATAGTRQGSGAAVSLALVTGVAIATYSVIDAYAVRLVQPLGYLGPVLGLEGLVLFAATGFDLGRLRAAASSGIRIAAGSTAAYMLVLLAFRRTGAGPVATVREVSVLLGIWLSRERPGVWAWVGGALCVAGAVLAAI